MWETVPWEPIGHVKRDLTRVAHTVIHIKCIPWAVCRHCRLALLRNEPSEYAWRLGCNWKDILKSRGMN